MVWHSARRLRAVTRSSISILRTAATLRTVAALTLARVAVVRLPVAPWPCATAVTAVRTVAPWREAVRLVTGLPGSNRASGATLALVESAARPGAGSRTAATRAGKSAC